MALMVLLRLPSQKDLGRIDFNGFYEGFIANTIAPFIARATINKNGDADLDGYSIPKADWFTLVED